MMRFASLLLFCVLALIGGFWFWLGKPVEMPPHAAQLNEPIYCVSFAPFRADQSPLDPTSSRITAQQVEEDLTRIRKVTDCVRTYATDFGSQHVPAIARKLGMKVYLGIWIGDGEMGNRVQIETALSLAARYPDVVRAMIVGNEVLLRRDQSPAAMAAMLKEVKSRTNVPVTYADVWEFWLKNPELGALVDFITIHTLPYWEDIPIAADKAAAHIDETRKEVQKAFPGKEILIGEVGWPSAGRMREGALPSLSNQARLLADMVRVAREGGYKFNWIEVIDQPWKRRNEGTVGGYWGIFEAGAEQPKFRTGAAVSDHPFWRIQAMSGAGLAVLLFGLAFLIVRTREEKTEARQWLGVAAIALASGALIGMSVEKLVLESLNAREWLFSSVRVLAMLIAVFAGVFNIITRMHAPSLANLSVQGMRLDWRSARWLDLVFAALCFFVLQSALAMAFDPRYRDFPAATLTIGLMPFLVMRLLKQGEHKVGLHALLAVLLGASTLWIVFNEGIVNWQAMWFAGALAVAVFLMSGFGAQNERDQHEGSRA